VFKYSSTGTGVRGAMLNTEPKHYRLGFSAQAALPMLVVAHLLLDKDSRLTFLLMGLYGYQRIEMVHPICVGAYVKTLGWGYFEEPLRNHAEGRWATNLDT
jgi:hypothetical protein